MGIDVHPHVHTVLDTERKGRLMEVLVLIVGIVVSFGILAAVVIYALLSGWGGLS